MPSHFTAFKDHLAGMNFERFDINRWRIRRRLVALVLAIALPLNILIGAALANLLHEAVVSHRNNLLYTARSGASGIDALLTKYLSIAADLLKSPALLADDLAVFEAEARQTLTGVPDASIILSDIDGQQLVNTSPAASRPLPRRGPQAMEVQQRALETRAITITGVRRGSVTKDWIASVEAPVMKDGKPYRVLSVAISLPVFWRLFAEQDMPASWLAGVIDQEGRFIARVPDNDNKVGQLASEGWRKIQYQDGHFEFPTLEGDMVVHGNAHSKLSRWTVGIAVKKAEMTRAGWRAIRWSALLGAAISLSSLLLAARVARSISESIDELRYNATALVSGTAPAYTPGTPEIAELWGSLRLASAERKRADRDLRRVSAQMAAIVASSNDAIISKTLDGTITSWNESAERLFGYAASEIVGQSIRKLIPNDRQAEEDDIIARLTKGEPIRSFETVRVAKDGHTLDVSVTISPILDTSGKLTGASKAVRDITERKEREMKLAESEARLSQILNTVNTFVGLVDVDGKLIEVNTSAAEAAGTAREDLIGMSMADAPWWAHSPQSAQEMADIIARCLDGDTVRRDLTYQAANGEIRWVDFQAAPIFSAVGSVTAVVPSGVDITERKRSEEQVRFLMLEVNHRAKNLLGVVSAIARQTASTSPGDFMTKFTQRINALSSNMDLLVNNEWRGVDLQPLAIAQLSHFSDAIGTRITITGPALRLNASAAQGIGMALHELATNAGKHGALSNDQGHIDLGWKLDGGQFVITWREQGGPPVEPPTRRGFGTTVVKTLAESSVKGKVDLDYGAHGLTWRLACPAKNALEKGETTRRPPR